MNKSYLVFQHRKILLYLPVLILLQIKVMGQNEGPNDRKKKSLSAFKNAIWESKSFFGVYLRTSILPKAKIEKLAGQYFLSPKPNISYSGGFRYIRNLKPEVGLISGVDLKFTKLNFYVFIPASDIPTIPRAFPNTPIVDYTEAHFHIAIPLLIERRFNVTENQFWALRGGGNINYNGFNLDGNVGYGVTDINGQGVGIYSGIFQYSNNSKPWITLVAGISKNLVLSNKNILSIDIGFEAGKNGYVSGSYSIAIPNKPVSYGTYKINGFSTGLTVAYTFTGTNRRLAKQYQK
ncbi:MAG: hypothetical protein HEQ40_10885 [Lacibacter sp.]|jgi:hypothetical protein